MQPTTLTRWIQRIAPPFNIALGLLVLSGFGKGWQGQDPLLSLAQMTSGTTWLLIGISGLFEHRAPRLSAALMLTTPIPVALGAVLLYLLEGWIWPLLLLAGSVLLMGTSYLYLRRRQARSGEKGEGHSHARDQA